MGAADLDDVGECLRLLIERPMQVAERRQQKLTDLAGRPQPAGSGDRKKTAKLDISWMDWLTAFAPLGVLLLVSLPLLVYVLYPPTIKEGSEVPAWAIGNRAPIELIDRSAPQSRTDSAMDERLTEIRSRLILE